MDRVVDDTLVFKKIDKSNKISQKIYTRKIIRSFKSKNKRLKMEEK